MVRTGVGVAIGRFQVHELHAGHLALLSRAAEHSKMAVFICQSPHLVTPDDPLDFPAREQMVKEAFPQAMVSVLHDQPTDEGWSADIDRWLSQTCPTDRRTLYFGRDSSIARYHGKCHTEEIDPVPYVSGTDLRAEIGNSVQRSKDWRAGVIYAANNMWPRAVSVTDVAITRHGESGLEVLVGMRHNEGGRHRFPGGHVNVSDDGAESAARREVSEETCVEATDYEIIGNYRVKGWRSSRGYALFTTLFHANYVSGAAHAKDDLDVVRWVPVADLLGLQFADDHEMLARELIRFLEEVTGEGIR